MEDPGVYKMDAIFEAAAFARDTFLGEQGLSRLGSMAAEKSRAVSVLKLLRWRSGVTGTVSITLEYLGGSYSATAPYNCPKSSKILAEGLARLMGTNVLGQPVAQETAGRYSFGTLSLLAANNPLDPANAARMAVCRGLERLAERL